MSVTDWDTTSAVTGLDSSDLPASSSSGASSALGLGSLAVGAGALGYMLSQGPSPLPSEYGTLTNTQVPTLNADATAFQNNVPALQGEATSLETGGAALSAQGTQALQMAQNGQLTPAQQAQLSLYSTGLNNKAVQTYASMGRNYNQDTSAISTQGEVDTQVNAMAQAQIQSTIQLGLGELSAGNQMTSQGLGFQNSALGYGNAATAATSAADSALIAAGQAQVQQDQSYSSSLTSVFSAVAKLAPAAIAAV